MAQRRLFNFQEDDSTYLLNNQHIAVIPPGLYRGFDFSNASSATNLVLAHTGTGYSEVTKDLALLNNLGMVRTKQGVNIIEDAPVTIPILSNAANNFVRVDIVLLEHEFVDVDGGIDANYVVIRGTSGTLPVIAFPEKQVLIGTITWPALAASLLSPNVVYDRAPSPTFNNDVDLVRRALKQTITGEKVFSFLTNKQATLTYDSTTKSLNSSVAANVYVVAKTATGSYLEVNAINVPFSSASNSNGTVLEIKIVTLQQLKFVSDGTNSANIVLLGGLANLTAESGETVTFRDMRNTSLGNSGTTTWYLDNGGAVAKNFPSKMYAKLMQAKGNATFNAGGIVLDGKGNYFDLVMNFGTGPILTISGSDNFVDSTITGSKEGAIICIRVSDSGSLPAGTLQLSQAGTSSGNDKKIVTLNGNQPVFSGDYLYFLELEDSYVMLNRASGTVNLYEVWQSYHALVQQEEKIFSKTVSTSWKVMGGAGFDTSTGVLSLTNDANSFEVTVPAEYNLKDIKLNRGGVSQTAPSGLIVNIRFKHSGYTIGLTESFYINLDPTLSNIRSTVSQETLMTGGGADRLYIQADALTDGDIYTFRKSNSKWDLIGMNLLPEIMPRVIVAENKLTTLVATAWTNMPYANGYANNLTIGGALQYRKTGGGKIEFRGSGGIASFASNANFGTLPAGYRPSVVQVRVPIAVTANGTNSNGWITVSPDGTIAANTQATIGTGSFYFYLDGASFNI